MQMCLAEQEEQGFLNLVSKESRSHDAAAAMSDTMLC